MKPTCEANWEKLPTIPLSFVQLNNSDHKIIKKKERNQIYDSPLPTHRERCNPIHLSFSLPLPLLLPFPLFIALLYINYYETQIIFNYIYLGSSQIQRSWILNSIIPVDYGESHNYAKTYRHSRSWLSYDLYLDRPVMDRHEFLRWTMPKLIRRKWRHSPTLIFGAWITRTSGKWDTWIRGRACGCVIYGRQIVKVSEDASDSEIMSILSYHNQSRAGCKREKSQLDNG